MENSSDNLDLQIKKFTVAPGEDKVIKLSVGQLPSGNPIHIFPHVFRSKKPGPTLLFLAGVHGDEINGVEIVRQSIEQKIFTNLQCGSVIAIPILNVYGFINFSREVPDGKDVNRSFPGAAKGSMASRVAYTLHKHILPHIDMGVDFHTGGRSNYNYPQIRYTTGDPVARELALAFGAPLTLQYASIRKSLRRVARDKHEAPILVFEGGENLRYDGLSIQKGLEGIRRLLRFYRMDSEPFESVPTAQFSRTSWLRASRGGLFQWMKPSGNWVKKGEPLGFINDPYGEKPTHYIKSPREGFIIGHNNTPVVSQGDALFHIAYHEEEPKPEIGSTPLS